MNPFAQLLPRLLLLLACWLSSAATVHASDEPLSPEMRALGVDELRGRSLERSLTFVDHDGQAVSLGQLFDGERPVLFTLNYYRCKVICSVQLNGLAAALRELEWTPGESFRVVTLSIDPRETPADAKRRRDTLLATVGKGEVDWTFLTGQPLAIKALAAELGIAFAYDAEQDQYAHPAVAVFAAPDGRIVQYLYGLTYEPRDLKFALIEAGEGKLGTPFEQVIMSCFHYDASLGRYGPFAFGIMRLGGGITLVVLATVLAVFWRRERRRTGRHAEALS